jgi:hypothetical protein
MSSTQSVKVCIISFFVCLLLKELSIFFVVFFPAGSESYHLTSRFAGVALHFKNCIERGVFSMRGPEGQSQSRVAGASIVSGAVSGMMGVATGFPLETLRVRVQVVEHFVVFLVSKQCCLQTQVAHVEYRGPLDCLIKTVRGEGIRGLYKVCISFLLI